MYPQAGLTLTSVRMMNFGAVGVSLWICEESLSIYCRSLLMEYRSVLMEHRSFLIELRARCCLCDWVFRCEGVSLDTWGVSFHGISVSFDGMYVSFHGTQVSFGGVVVQVSFVEIQVSLDRTWWSLILWNIRLFWWNTRLFSWDSGLFWSNTSLFWWNQKGVSFEGVSFDRIWVSFDPIKGSQVFVWHLSVYIAEVCIPYWQKGGGETSAIGREALQTYDRIPVSGDIFQIVWSSEDLSSVRVTHFGAVGVFFPPGTRISFPWIRAWSHIRNMIKLSAVDVSLPPEI